MTPEKDQELRSKYPLIFRNRNGDMRTTALCRGLEVGDGWFNLINTACRLIEGPYRSAAEHYERLKSAEGKTLFSGGTVIDAAAVESARLKMQEAAAEVPVAVQVKEKFGTLRFYLDNANAQAGAYVRFAEEMSACTCEQCGAPGHRQGGGGWIRTLCTACLGT